MLGGLLILEKKKYLLAFASVLFWGLKSSLGLGVNF